MDLVDSIAVGHIWGEKIVRDREAIQTNADLAVLRRNAAAFQRALDTSKGHVETLVEALAQKSTEEASGILLATEIISELREQEKRIDALDDENPGLGIKQRLSEGRRVSDPARRDLRARVRAELESQIKPLVQAQMSAQRAGAVPESVAYPDPHPVTVRIFEEMKRKGYLK